MYSTIPQFSFPIKKKILVITIVMVHYLSLLYLGMMGGEVPYLSLNISFFATETEKRSCAPWWSNPAVPKMSRDRQVASATPRPRQSMGRVGPAAAAAAPGLRSRLCCAPRRTTRRKKSARRSVCPKFSVARRSVAERHAPLPVLPLPSPPALTAPPPGPRLSPSTAIFSSQYFFLNVNCPDTNGRTFYAARFLRATNFFFSARFRGLIECRVRAQVSFFELQLLHLHADFFIVLMFFFHFFLSPFFNQCKSAMFVWCEWLSQVLWTSSWHRKPFL